MEENMNEGKKTTYIILSAFLLYLPFIFLGYGSDCDSYSVINTAKTLVQQHRYIPSRYPGNVVHELATTLLFMVGGSLLTNLGTMVMSLLVIGYFIKICGYYKVPHKHLLAIFMIIHPVYAIASTSTIDYLWALGFLLIGYTLIIKKRYLLSGIFLGLAIGARISSVLFVVGLLLAYFLTKEPERNKVFLSAATGAIVGAAFFTLPFWHAGCTFGFFTHYFHGGNWLGYLERFVYKNIYFWGLQMCIAFLFLSSFIANGFKRNCEPRYKNLLVVSIIVIALIEMMYLEIPSDKGYLLPILPFVLILLGVTLEKHRWLIILLIVIQCSYNFININIARPNIPNHATTAKVGLWFERGYLINDIIERVKMRQLYHGL